MNPVGKVLNSNKGLWRFAGFTAANIAGLAVILGAFQLYRDAAPLLTGPDSFMRNDYVILSKKVTSLQAVGVGSSDFRDSEIGDIASQPFVVRTGVFTPATYHIDASVSAGGMGMSSFLFFEAVPDAFIDVKSDIWRLDTASKVIPIIIPRNYLNLYNYGFSRSQGLPQVSEDLFGALTVDLRLAGNGHTDRFEGRIAGFSDRLNTILVPQEFMEWSNARFGGGEKPAVSRVIAEVTDASSDELALYLSDRGYETEGENAGRGTGAWFLRLITGIVLTVGLIITVLAFSLLILSIFLLLQKNSGKLRDLMLLGFSPGQVSMPYIRLALVLNASGLVVALAAVGLLRGTYLPVFARMTPGYDTVGFLPTVLVGIVLAALSAATTALLIRRKVIRLW
ncbi:MAG: ABC transporter permease [Rikenellaceae bacterium]|nr:ABC transporter permease [Rikenellaceae bacterium]